MAKSIPDTSIIIPAYNEEENLGLLIPEWMTFCNEHNFEIIIVNDGSKDNSKNLLNSLQEKHPNLNIIHHKINRGYGGALKTGLAAADTEYAITIDADGQHQLESILQLRNTIKTQDADLVVGNRGTTNDNPYRKLGKKIIRALAKILFPDLPVEDINSGLKIYRTEHVQKYLSICPNEMAFSDIITLIFVKKRCKVLEEPVVIAPRKAGVSTINTKTAFETIWKILVIMLMFNPIRIFLPVSAFFFALGIGWTLKFIFIDEGFTIASAILIIIGIVVFDLWISD